MAFERRLKLVTRDPEASEMEIAVKVAFATSDRKRVDQHFGTAQSFALYALDRRQAKLIEVVQFDPLATKGHQEEGGKDGSVAAEGFGHLRNAPRHNENRLATKIDALDGCIAVYCRAVGASAIHQLHIRGIRAIRVPMGSEIRDLLQVLQEELSVVTGTWLEAATMRKKPREGRRFDEMEREGWIE